MNKRVLVIVFAALLFCESGVVCAQRLNAPSSVSSQELLPASTKAWVSIPDSKQLNQKFLETQIGKLTKDEKLAPFIESLKTQFRDWMNEKNVRLGLNFEDVQEIRSGEICFAGILPSPNPINNNDKLGRGSHGMVLLVDVSQNLDEAKALLENLADDLTKRGATKEKYGDEGSVFGAEVSKWKFPKKSRIKSHRFAYQTITSGWLLSSDNEIIFREIVRRLVNIDNVKAGETLAAQKAFQTVMKTVALDGVEPDVFWYVNPFGYIQLAQTIAREEQEFNQTNNDDWARILKKIGFDGFKGVGGFIAFATGDHEFLHRTYVHKPVDEGQDVKQRQVFGLFDFENTKKSGLAPPNFVPNSVSGYFGASWNMQRALKNVGHAIDTFAKKQGTFDDTLDSLRVEMKVDVPEVVSKFDDEFIVISDSELPIQDDSERLVVAIRLNGDKEYVIGNIKKSWPHQHRQFEYNGFEIVEIDDSIGNEDIDDLELEDDPFRDPSEIDEDEELDEEEVAFSLFEKRFCCASDEYLFIANNLDYLKKMLSGDCENSLSDSTDYTRVQTSLGKIVDESRISFRNFGRMDRIMRPNYEMMRTGKMAANNTILARLINHVFESNSNDSDQARTQKIDGSKLPSDFDKHVAPYFGPAGWVMESTKDGWLFSGIMLERQDFENQVVKKEDVTSPQHK